MDQAPLEYPVKPGLIFCLDRAFPYELNEIIAEKAIAWRDRGVVGVDIAGPESATFRVADYRRLMRRVRQFGLGITVHTGESGPVEEVARVIELLEPDRIGHGVKAAYDPRAMAMLSERGIVLEICPTSNLNTGVVSGWDEIRWIFDQFRRNGVRFTISTDGPEMLQTYIRDELATLGRLGILSVDEQEQVARPRWPRRSSRTSPRSPLPAREPAPARSWSAKRPRRRSGGSGRRPAGRRGGRPGPGLSRRDAASRAARRQLPVEQQHPRSTAGAVRPRPDPGDAAAITNGMPRNGYQPSARPPNRIVSPPSARDEEQRAEDQRPLIRSSAMSSGSRSSFSSGAGVTKGRDRPGTCSSGRPTACGVSRTTSVPSTSRNSASSGLAGGACTRRRPGGSRSSARRSAQPGRRR